MISVCLYSWSQRHDLRFGPHGFQGGSPPSVRRDGGCLRPIVPPEVNLIVPEGQLDYELQDDDHVVFISTLHGG
ncbi:hypothetical protein NHX12_027023 [Muraenolepis orangiensis]|uniref:Ubiquitin-related modifier 1 n=1 Tax=Muraenolepis orangiensis TaxID=630683 RepID=A0A9Q0EBN0_9TELE|nr:hypothetical protein NHX12_027023 [Muraenolepis orangiensis]